MSKCPKMTRAQFELIARALRDARPISSANTPALIAARGTLDNVALFLADSLQFTNSKFNRDRFLAACGVQS